jgi:hypothetical protein
MVFKTEDLYVGRSNLNENLVPSRAQINLYERACADKLWHVYIFWEFTRCC